MKRLVFALAIAFMSALTACGKAATPTAPPTMPPTATPTATFTPTPTATSTSTSTPAPTFTPTLTPTVALPVTNGTPLPPLAPIGDEWGKVRLVGEYVAPYPVEAAVNSDFYRVFIYGKKVEVRDQKGKLLAKVPLRVEPGYWGSRDIRLAVGKGYLAAVSKDKKSITIYDWAGNKVRSIYPPSQAQGLIISLALSPDGKTLAYVTGNPLSGDMGTFWVVDVLTGQLRFRQRIFGEAQFTPNSRYLAVPFDRSLHVYNVQTGKQVYRVWLGNWEYTVYFASSGERLALYRWNTGTIEIVDKGKTVRVVNLRRIDPSAGLYSVLFSPSEKTLAVNWISNKKEHYLTLDITSGKQLAKGNCTLASVNDNGKGTCFSSSPPFPQTLWQRNEVALLRSQVQWEWISYAGHRCFVNPDVGSYTCEKYKIWEDPAFTKKFPDAFGYSFPRWFDKAGHVWGALWIALDGMSKVLAINKGNGEQILQRDYRLASASILPDAVAVGYVSWLGNVESVLIQIRSLRYFSRAPSQTLRWTLPFFSDEFPIALCGKHYLAIALPSWEGVTVYDLRTKKSVFQAQSPRLITELACDDNSLVVLDTAHLFQIYGIPLDKSEENP